MSGPPLPTAPVPVLDAAAAPRAQSGTRQLDDRLFLACALAWGAGVIHVAAAVSHLDEFVLFAVFFEVLALAQFAWGVALYRAPSRRLLLVGAIGSLAVVALWAVSRTSGLPIGPSPWRRPEAVGLLDSLATADELALAAIVFLRIRAKSARRWERRVGTVVAAVALGLLLTSSLALVSGGHVH